MRFVPKFDIIVTKVSGISRNSDGMWLHLEHFLFPCGNINLLVESIPNFHITRKRYSRRLSNLCDTSTYRRPIPSSQRHWKLTIYATSCEWYCAFLPLCAWIFSRAMVSWQIRALTEVASFPCNAESESLICLQCYPLHIYGTRIHRESIANGIIRSER